MRNPEKARVAEKRWRSANPETVNAKKRRAYARMSPEKKESERLRLRQWGIDNREKERARGRRKHGLPDANRPCPDNCEICGRASWLELRAFALDHDHNTGAFRGWLCAQCNTALGLLGDSVDVLSKAIAYLKRAQ